jgi:AdoMet-dependent rRNA methyltransferase SPB1
MFDDEGLPHWFVEDENRHNQPNKPVTREEVAAERAQFKEIDARPSKKVAEAKARKKRVAMKKLDKARQKADAIADQSDINERSKSKMIDRIYKKAMPKKPQKEYVVAKKGVQNRAGKGKVLVDPRMKKDKRAKKGGKGAKGRSGKRGKKAGKSPR